MSSRQRTVIPGTGSADASLTRRDDSYETITRNTQTAGYKPSNRTITGVLVSFTWQRQGDLFVLYEGRNVIGKGTVESEGGRPCDILLSVDPTISNEHAVILCRAGRYELFDNRSTNGTYADDKFVESTGVKLRDGARIKTGETNWIFRMIEADEVSETPEQRREEVREERREEAREEAERKESPEPHRRGDSRMR